MKSFLWFPLFLISSVTAHAACTTQFGGKTYSVLLNDSRCIPDNFGGSIQHCEAQGSGQALKFLRRCTAVELKNLNAEDANRPTVPSQPKTSTSTPKGLRIQEPPYPGSTQRTGGCPPNWTPDGMGYCDLLAAEVPCPGGGGCRHGQRCTADGGCTPALTLRGPRCSSGMRCMDAGQVCHPQGGCTYRDTSFVQRR